MSEITFPRGKLPMDYLQGLLVRYTARDPRLVAGPRVGEDVAVIDMGDRYMVVKTDPVTFATDQIGWYVVNVNANDIATSGARPLWMLATVLLPEGRSTPSLVESIFGQISDACQELGVPVHLVKMVSDNADETAHDWSAAVDGCARELAAWLADFAG